MMEDSTKKSTEIKGKEQGKKTTTFPPKGRIKDTKSKCPISQGTNSKMTPASYKTRAKSLQGEKGEKNGKSRNHAFSWGGGKEPKNVI